MGNRKGVYIQLIGYLNVQLSSLGFQYFYLNFLSCVNLKNFSKLNFNLKIFVLNGRSTRNKDT